jgi:hypothetical protein
MFRSYDHRQAEIFPPEPEEKYVDQHAKYSVNWKLHLPPCKHPYFDAVVGLKWSYDHEKYARVPTGRLPNAAEVKGGDSGKSGYPGSPSWELGSKPQSQKPQLFKNA